ncbi:MAG: hypothetical protein AAB739_00630 [Patescibacteria group bacterium]
MAKTSALACTLLLSILLTGCSDPVGDKYVSFAKCVTEKGATMYGTYWCSHCANQKAMFGKLGFAEINYIECDPRGANAKPELCLKNKVDGYPTWIFADGSRMEGEVPLPNLAEKTGCKLPVETPAENPAK